MTTNPVLRIRCRSAWLLAALLLAPATRIDAQVREPVGPFAADVRVAMPRFKEDVIVASDIGVDSIDMPTSGLGLVFGAHWYPVRSRRVTLGVGGEILLSRGSKTPEVAEDDGLPPAVPGPTVNTRFSSVSPQVSLNFGSNRGWSYLTGGLGWGGFVTEREDAPVADGDSSPRVLNYGGGARWFVKQHVAFALDLRFYAVGAQEATIERPAYPARTMMVFSAGISFK
jgi:hypothetical protein